MRFVSVHVVHLHSSMDSATAWKKSCFILSDRSNFHMIDNQWIAAHAFFGRISTSFSVDEILLTRFVNLFTNFRGLPLRMDIVPSCLKRMNSVLFEFKRRPIPLAVCSTLWSGHSAWAGVFARSAILSAESASVLGSMGYRLFLAFFFF